MALPRGFTIEYNFGASASVTSLAVGLNSSDFAIADFNRDGYVDFVFCR